MNSKFNRIRMNAGWLLFSALSVLPVLLWLPASAGKMDTPVGILNILGQLTGLVGMATFSLSMVLAARTQTIENMFSGLDKAYKSHRVLGIISFLLVLFHPLLLAAKYVRTSLSDASFFLSPGGDFAVDTGFIALFGMMLLIAGTLFVRIKYHKWKSLHKFMGIFFIFAAIHTFLVPSDISRIFSLKVYMASVTSLGIVAFAYRTLGGVFVRKYEYIVEGVQKLGDGVIEIEMSPRSARMPFHPGQFIFVSFHRDIVSSESHPFSISSSPGDEKLRVCVKSLGDYTSELVNLRKGTTARVEGPFGKLCMGDGSYVWIAGGIGVTPFMSMARSIGSNCNVDLYYCAKNRGEALFIDELERISSESENFRVIPHYSETHGRITAEKILETSRGLARRKIVLCGPPPMMLSLKEQMEKLGVPSRNIHYESFQFM